MDFSESRAEPPTSAAVRRFLCGQGVKEHNHASEVARIIGVDRSQSYRRLKGEVAWSHTDLRAIATHFGAPTQTLLQPDEPAAGGAGHPGPPAAEQVAATLRVAALASPALLVPGPALAADEACALVAVHSSSGWAVYLEGECPPGAQRHAIDSLTLRSHPYLQVALLEDDTPAAQALVEAFRPLGIVATPFADGASLLAASGQRRYDAFVLDWLLPGGATAASVLEAIRHASAQVPVVVVTGAMADVDMERTLLELSARWNFSTLDKPVRPMNLANTLKQLVQAKKIR